MKNHLVLAIALLTTNVSFAATTQIIPDKCPSVSALAQAPLTLAQIDFPSNTYIAAAFDNTYDTNAKWTFVVANVKASGAVDAIKKATADIPKFISTTTTPQQFGSLSAWGCGYQSDMGYSVFAVSQTDAISPKNLSEIVKQLHG